MSPSRLNHCRPIRLAQWLLHWSVLIDGRSLWFCSIICQSRENTMADPWLHPWTCPGSVSDQVCCLLTFLQRFFTQVVFPQSKLRTASRIKSGFLWRTINYEHQSNFKSFWILIFSSQHQYLPPPDKLPCGEQLPLNPCRTWQNDLFFYFLHLECLKEV